MITVIGLGVEKGDLTRRGEEVILQAVKEGRPIFVRTANTRSYQTVVELGVPHTALDYVYERSRNFATLALQNPLFSGARTPIRQGCGYAVLRG